MVSFKFFTKAVPLEDFYLEGPAIIAGLNKKEALHFSRQVLGKLQQESRDSISFRYLINLSSKFIKDNTIRRKYVSLCNYFLACYRREVRKPFFIFIGGSPSAGKDLLSADLQYYLGPYGVDRIVLTDLLRENCRTELIKKYGSLSKVPKKYKPLFLPTYKVDEEGLKLQINYVKKYVRIFFVEQALREYKRWVHPFYILQGIHVVPGVDEAVKGNNKLMVIINPSEEEIKSRIFFRQERERGPFTKENRKERERECNKSIEIKNQLEEITIKHGGIVIHADSRMEALHLFGDYLINQLEKVLYNK